MEKYLKILSSCILFKNINTNEIDLALKCLNPVIKQYNKNESIISADEEIKSIGIILNGSINIIRDDVYGNRRILAHFTESQIFAEALAILNKTSMNTIIATEKTEVMFISIDKVLGICNGFCSYHSKLIKNLVSILAQKNYILNQKIDHITCKTTKDKILSYLYEQSRVFQSNSFIIPYNRQELADYLNVERSALSNELSKLKKEGIISFNKNYFTIKNTSQI